MERFAKEGTPAILVRRDTTTADIDGIARADGILTGTGARTSHAAVLARQLGKVCLVGCASLSIDVERALCRIGEHVFGEGDVLSLDGNSGAIYSGSLPIVAERPERELAAVAQWRTDLAGGASVDKGCATRQVPSKAKSGPCGRCARRSGRR